MTGSILLVCTANVCRSPLAAAVFADVLENVTVASAGVRAVTGAPMCAVSAFRLPEGAESPHEAQQLSRGLIDDADMIITMERGQRSAAVRMAPGAQSKVFTLREVVALSEGMVQRDVPSLDTVAALASGLHGCRGLIPIPAVEQPTRRWWQRPVEPADPLTIVDGHGLDPAVHAAAVDEVLSAALDAAGAFRALGSSRDARPVMD